MAGQFAICNIYGPTFTKRTLCKAETQFLFDCPEQRKHAGICINYSEKQIIFAFPLNNSICFLLCPHVNLYEFDKHSLCALVIRMITIAEYISL